MSVVLICHHLFVYVIFDLNVLSFIYDSHSKSMSPYMHCTLGSKEFVVEIAATPFTPIIVVHCNTVIPS